MAGQEQYRDRLLGLQEVVNNAGLSAQQVEGFQKIGGTPRNTTEYVDKTITPGKLYRYGVSTEGKWRSGIAKSTMNEPVGDEPGSDEPDDNESDEPATPNRAPTANAQTLNVEEDTAKTFTLTGTDPENSPLTYSVVTQPTNGTLSGDAPELTYTPNANYNGADTFTFTVSDGELTSEAATVTIDVGNGNDAPTDITLSNNTVEENQSEGSVVGSFSATDVDNTSFTYSLVAGEGDTDNASFIVEGSDLKTAFAFDFEDKSEYSVRAEVNDGDASFAKSFTITVSDVDDEDPTVTFNDPGRLSVSSEVILSGTASDNMNVTQVEVFEDDVSVGVAALDNDTWNLTYTAPQSEGDVLLRAVATDAASDSGEADRTVNVFSPVVTNTDDSGPGSLRQVISSVPADTTITFAPELSGQTITLTSGQLTLNKNVTIQGDVSVSGDGKSRVFYVSGGVTAELRDLSITKGNANEGGGIYNRGTLTLTDVIVANNSVSRNPYGYGGGIYNNIGVLNLNSNSSIRDNSAPDQGGGVYNFYGTFTLNGSSSIKNNTTTGTGGGVFHQGGTLTLNDSTSVSGNSANYGASVLVRAGTLTGADYEGNDTGDDEVYNIFGNTPDQVYPR